MRARGYAKRAFHLSRGAQPGEYCVKGIRLFSTIRSTMSESATQAPTHEVILTDVAAAKVKSLLEQEVATTCACVSPCSPVAARA